MKVYKEISLEDFEFWGAARETYNAIYNAGCEEQLENLLEETYPKGIDETELNDILAYDSEWLFDVLEVPEEEEEEEKEIF